MAIDGFNPLEAGIGVAWANYEHATTEPYFMSPEMGFLTGESAFGYNMSEELSATLRAAAREAFDTARRPSQLQALL